jgi:putative ABC transport system permease protein
MWRKLQWWLRRKEIETDLEEELRSHMALEGGSSDDARRAFGNVTRIQEETREAWGWMSVERFWNDVRFGLRTLRKSAGWAAVMSVTLALGIGLTAAIFSVVYGVLLQPLPYPQPDRLIALWTTSERAQDRFSVNAANWVDWRAQSQTFEDIALTDRVNLNLTGDGLPERIEAAPSSWNLPQVMGVQPILGRVYTEDEVRNYAKVAILSDGFWQRRFARDPKIVGRKIQLDGISFEVIGVMPAAFAYPAKNTDLWMPLNIPLEEMQLRVAFDYVAVGRLKPGMNLARAQEEMSTIMRRLGQQYPKTNGTLGVVLELLLDTTVAGYRAMLLLLMGAAGALLLIGCLNLGILLLARANARAPEIALRVALGASVGRLRTQVLAEVLPLGLIGAAGGIAVAWGLVRILPQWLPVRMPRTEDIGLHGPVLAFALAMSLLIVITAALLPARFASRLHRTNPLRRSSRTATAGDARRWLVSAQVAITVAVLFGSSLLVRSMIRLLDVNPGFTTDGLLTMQLSLIQAKYATDAEAAGYYARLIDRVQQVPGVVGAGLVNRLPLSGNNQTMLVGFEGRPGAESLNAESRTVTPGYFSAIGIPIVRGRPFAATDNGTAERVAILDERIAREVFGTADPIGKRVRIAVPGMSLPWVQIVGVAGHVLTSNLETDRLPQVYWPISQWTQPRAALVVRTQGRPESFTSALIAKIREENPDQALYDIRTMREWVDRSLQSRTLTTALVAVFGGAGLLLACLGLYGVVSYSTGLRLREFGIRLALGAKVENVRGIVVRQALRLVAVGSAAGLLLAWPVGEAIRSQLFGIQSFDVVSLLVAPGLLLLVAVFAALGPANRAARVNPSVTLRAD